jgi:hypothetical protein
MAQWEYRAVDLNAVPRRGSSVDLLDSAGGDGWELVTVANTGIAYLKRQMPEAARTRRRTPPGPPSGNE